jgi:hypothetical protein
MKPRHRVFVTLEIETDLPISSLRRTTLLGFWRRMKVIQASANRVRLSKGNPVFPRRKKASGKS